MIINSYSKIKTWNQIKLKIIVIHHQLNKL